MKILVVSSEVTPFAKTGGLADVAAALPKELVSRGHDVRIAMPRYGRIDVHRKGGKIASPPIDVTFPGLMPPETFSGVVLESPLPGSNVPVYFIDEPVLFDRPHLYGVEGEDYPDNGLRFAFFCKMVLLMLKHIDWRPDIIQCNDWQTGLIPTFLKNDPVFVDDPFYSPIKTLFTIHNIGYQGHFPAQMIQVLGLPLSVYSMDGMEFWGKVSFLKGGLAYCDEISTVSERYSREIQTAEFGNGMDGFLLTRRDRLSGIINGVDYADWNPETDTLIEKNFSIADMSGKAACKAALQKAMGLPADPGTLLIGIVSRLDGQKGFDILEHALPGMMKLNLQIVILGTGHPFFHDLLQRAQEAHPTKLRVCLRFDNHLAHAIEAGSDAFLMPSRYEPCGLNQLYSLKYGTVPIVRHTGGLVDTVVPAVTENIKKGTATGFAFSHYSAPELARTVYNAHTTYYERPDLWQQIRRTGMEQDFSWTRSAQLYEELFQKMVARG